MHRMRSNFQWYFKIVIVFTIINLFTRILDFTLILLHQADGLMSYFDLLKAMASDFMLSLAFAGLFFVFFIIFSLINKYLARTLSVLFFILINILNIGLVLYFDFTKVPLDQVVFVYKLNTLIDIVQLSGGTQLSSIFPIILGIVIFLGAYILILKVKFPKVIVNIALFIMVFAAASTNIYIQKSSAFPSEQSYYCNQNKIIYFVKKSINYYKLLKVMYLNVGGSTIQNYQNTDPQHKAYKYTQFPFYHFIEPNSNLSTYFKDLPKGEKPNIVFIVVESLCHDLSGKYSPNHSITPFLDSLTQQSLY